MLGSTLYGEWCVQAGLPQGAALSLCLFSLIILQLVDEPKAANCGIILRDLSGAVHHVALLAFVDDLVLLANSATELQRALDIVSRWAKRVRMRLNIGTNKTACMRFGLGRKPTPSPSEHPKLNGVCLPIVAMYKYLGVHLGSGGGTQLHVDTMCSKASRKTWEILNWCRAHHATVDIANRLWLLYVLRAAVYGAAVHMPGKSSNLKLETAQRVCGRLLLGLSKSCPAACVLPELGWQSLRSLVENERLLLFKRLACSDNSLIQLAIDCSTRIADSWTNHCCDLLRPWCSEGATRDTTSWPTIIRKRATELKQWEAQDAIDQCSRHPGLLHYLQEKWTLDQAWCMNPFLHHSCVPRESALIMTRLLCGACNLRAGDPRHPIVTTLQNCCVWCLQEKKLVPETLAHVAFDCPTYAALRNRQPIAASLHERNPRVFVQHRSLWSWKQLREFRKFFVDVMELRATMSGGSKKGLAGRMQALAEDAYALLEVPLAAESRY